jgi:hypothetical protein
MQSISIFEELDRAYDGRGQLDHGDSPSLSRGSPVEHVGDEHVDSFAVK